MGKIMEQLIDNISKMSDENPSKELNTEQLANQMKKSYLTWNKDMVEDEKILMTWKLISRGRLKVREDMHLQEVTDIIKIQKKKAKLAPDRTGSTNKPLRLPWQDLSSKEEIPGRGVNTARSQE